MSDAVSAPPQDDFRKPKPAGSDMRRGLWLVAALATAYALIHAGIRLLKSNVLGEDDDVANIYAQTLQLGYDSAAAQPPLYNWIAWGVQQGLGPTLESFLLIKYAALVATCLFLYLAAMRVIGDRLYAVLTVESLALIYSISWRYHEGFTHQVLAMTLVAASGWLALRVLQDGGWRDYLGLGLALGLGLLTEPMFAIFVVSLFAAGTVQPSIRRAIFHRRMIAAAVVTAAIIAPFAIWVTSDAARAASWLHLNAAYGSRTYWRGIVDALRGPFFYLAPLIVIVPLVFPGTLAAVRTHIAKPRNISAEPDTTQFLWHLSLVGFALSVMLAVFAAAGRQPIHAFMPLFLLSTIWMFAMVRDSAGHTARLKPFAYLAAAIAVVALTARLANLYVMEPACGKCRWGIPYAGLAAELSARGMDRGTLVFVDTELAGNLRQLLPYGAIVTTGAHAFRPDSSKLKKPIAFVWQRDIQPERWHRTFATDQLAAAFSNNAKVASALGDLDPSKAETVSIGWQHLWRPTGYRTTEWTFLITPKHDETSDLKGKNP